MKKISRRSFLQASSAAVAATALAACSSDSSSSTAASSTASSSDAAAEKDPATVTLWHMYAEDEEVTKPHQRMLAWAEEFNATNTDNITVEVSGAKTADVIMTTIASGATPDIFQNYWNNAPTWANNGALYDLTDALTDGDADWDMDDFMDSTWGICVYDDKYYSVPFTMSTTVMTYDIDALADAGWDYFPTTMDELAQCIDDCTVVAADGTIEKFGMIPAYPWLDNVLWPVAFGAQFDDGAGNITFNEPNMLAAYQFQADIYDKYGYENITRFIDTLGSRATETDPLFTGKLAIRWNSDSSIASMVECAALTGTNMGIATMPAATAADESQNMLTGGVWEVNAKTANAEATITVLKSLTSAAHMAYMAEGDYGNGAFMPRASALTALTEMDSVSDAAKEIAVMLRDGATRAFPMSAYVNEYLTEIATYMQEAIMGNMTVEDAAQAVVDAVQPIADSYA